MVKSLVFASVLGLAGGALGADLPSIVSKGSKLFYPNGTEFFIKGIAYQQDVGAKGSAKTSATYLDPLSDEKRCSLDVPLLQEAGTNAIRTYSIDPTADHSGCMKLLQDAGIYVISDLSNPDYSINRDDAAWNVDLYQHYQSVVDELEQYSNVIGFFVGNEVSNAANNTGDSAFVKAAVRDMKQYIKDKKYRWMGIGYAADDSSDIRNEVADYFGCGNTDDILDFYGYNVYSWCDPSNFESSGYNRIIDFFTGYPAAVFFAEYGCNLPNGSNDRQWEETTALYEQNMTDVMSGGLVYEYFETVNDYGLVDISVAEGKPSERPDFPRLVKKVNAAHPSGTSMSDYKPDLKPRDCPKNSTWEASSILPPTPDADTCSCMAQQAKCVVKSSVSAKDYGKIFNYICGSDASVCEGIDANATTGKYGSYSPCSAKDQLTYVLNAYYEKQGSDSSACDFNGQAETQAGTKNSSCKALPPAVASNSSDGDSGDSSSSGSGSSDDDSASVRMTAPFSLAFGLVGAAVMLFSL